MKTCNRDAPRGLAKAGSVSLWILWSCVIHGFASVLCIVGIRRCNFRFSRCPAKHDGRQA
jgi:hypothetical protein